MIGKNTLYQTVLTIFSSLIGFLVLSFSARLFGPDNLGLLAYMFSLTGIIYAFADLGFSKAHVFYTASSKAPGKNLGSFIIIKATLLLITSLIAFIYGLFFAKDVIVSIFVLVIFIQISTRLADAMLITFEAKQISIPQNTIKAFSKLIRLISIFILASMFINVFSLSLTYLIEGTVLLILSLVIITRFKPFKFSKTLVNKYLLYSLPFFAIIPLSYLQENSLVVILKKLTNAQQVGFYSATASLTGSIKSIYAISMLYFFPRIARLFATKQTNQIKPHLNMAVKYLLVIFTPIFAILYSFNSQIIPLILGEQFIEAIPVFSWMLLGTFILMISAAYDQVLFATKNYKPMITINLVTLITAIGLSFVLVPKLGAMATAIICCLVWLISAIWHLYLVKKRLQISFLKHAPAIILLSLIIILPTNLTHSLVLKLAISPFTVLLYFLLLYWLKIITKLDIKYLKTLVNLK